VSLLREFEQLLREIAEQQAGQQAAPRPVPRPVVREAEIIEEVEPEVVEAEPVRPRETVAEHVSHYLDSQEMAQRAAALGAEVRSATSDLEARLHETFDHEVGKVVGAEAQASSQAPTPPGVVPTAGEIAHMLRSPASIRQAVVLSEILNRPQHLW
jgi:hypothetical protein